MEIPDAIAINKSEQPGAKALLGDIRSVLSLASDTERRPAVVLTEALRREGVGALWDALVERREALAREGQLEERRQQNLREEVVAAAAMRLRARVEQIMLEDAQTREVVAAVQRRELDPLSAVDRIVATVLEGDVP
jgi:putative protein kinase ArgK-like GTPase of G3E family